MPWAMCSLLIGLEEHSLNAARAGTAEAAVLEGVTNLATPGE